MVENFPYCLSGVDDSLFEGKIKNFASGDRLRFKSIVIYRDKNCIYVTTEGNTTPENAIDETKAIFDVAQKQLEEITNRSFDFKKLIDGVSVEFLLFGPIGNFLAIMKDGEMDFDIGRYLQMANRESFGR